jgi:Gram-negative bacterial TonB protein C-terminal
MRSLVYTTNNLTRGRQGPGPAKAARFVAASFVIFLFGGIVPAQRIALIDPEKAAQNEPFYSNLKASLSKQFVLLEDGMSEAAFNSVHPEMPFNMTTDTARNVGAVIGCEYFIMVRAASQRRTSLERSTYFEASAAVFAVSSRTGRLVFWKLQKFEASDAKKAETSLANSTGELAGEIREKLKTIKSEELAEKPDIKMEEPPTPDSAEAKNFRSPVPYKRVKPAYTTTAYFYNVAATVDALVDVDEKGSILRVEIVRWAGYGLDESVTEAIRKMNWRPGERGGKTLPVRVLLRYNFRKPDKE